MNPNTAMQSHKCTQPSVIVLSEIKIIINRLVLWCMQNHKCLQIAFEYEPPLRHCTYIVSIISRKQFQNMLHHGTTRQYQILIER